LLFAALARTSICTTSTLPSLGGLSGVFDAPKEKCRDLFHGHGSSVTAKFHASAPAPTPTTTTLPSSTKRIDIPLSAAVPLNRTKYYNPLTPSSSPIGVSIRESTIASALTRGSAPPTPPNTPPLSGAVAQSNNGNARLDVNTSAFPAKLFPNNVNEIARLAKSISLESFQPDGSSVFWDGFILKTPPPQTTPSRRSPSGSPPLPTARSAFKGARAAEAASAAAAAAASGQMTKMLYMSAQGAFKQYDRVRETIVALLDLASEHLDCDALVMVLDRGAVSDLNPAYGNGNPGGISGAVGEKQEFSELLHSLMYVGGTVVTKPPFPADPRFVLVGIEV
jgi:hypothetical protein